VREDGPGDRVVLGVSPLVACGAQGAPTPIHDGHLARARQHLQRSPGQRGPRRFMIEKSRDLRRSHACFWQLPRPAAVRGLWEPGAQIRFAIEGVSFRFFLVGCARSQRFACLCRETEGSGQLEEYRVIQHRWDLEI